MIDRVSIADGVWRWNTARGTLVKSDAADPGIWVCTITVSRSYPVGSTYTQERLQDIEELVKTQKEIKDRKEKMDALLDSAQVLLLAGISLLYRWKREHSFAYLSPVEPEELRVTFFEGSADTACVFREQTLGQRLSSAWPDASLAKHLQSIVAQEPFVRIVE